MDPVAPAPASARRRLLLALAVGLGLLALAVVVVDEVADPLCRHGYIAADGACAWE